MPSEREKLSSLTPKDYNIAGNEFRAYYDDANNLVFVVDNTLDDRKPNVLLVIDPYGDRKWDDVLANDYGMDLETVRPKKDNKYQKLDIEYSGLGEYDDLIRQYESGQDLTDALAALSHFRDASVRRAATERMAAAVETAEKSRDTIIKTNESISQLQSRIKQLRTKLSQHKKSVGREPTKQSAAKILRTESQIDATNEKLRRAKKRLSNAQRRLVAADEDAEIAREILARVPAGARTGAKRGQKSALPAQRPPHDLVAQRPAPVPAKSESEIIEIITEPQPKAEVMADEEVKPLFDKDPEILDEEIAFKPIEFDVPAAGPVVTPKASEQVAADVYEQTPPAPLSFTPPVSNNVSTSQTPIEVRPIADVPQIDTPSQPVLDTITSVDMPQSDNNVPSDIPAFTAADRPAPVMPTVPGTNSSDAEPDIAPAPISSDFRPVSPISGTSVAANEPTQRKPAFLYYIMLILLIVLSIFTLWLYQKSSSDNVPDLTTVSSSETVEQAPVVKPNQDTPFISPSTQDNMVVATETVQITPPAPIVEPEPVVIPEPTPEPVPVSAPVAQPEPVVVDEAIPEPVPVTPQPEPQPKPEPVPVLLDINETPFITAPTPVAAPAEPVVNKPAYNVSQQENMFVAGPDYESDAQYYADEQYQEPAETCEGGALPNANGCCPGEIFTDMEDGTYACCTSNGVECYPPMN